MLRISRNKKERANEKEKITTITHHHQQQQHQTKNQAQNTVQPQRGVVYIEKRWKWRYQFNDKVTLELNNEQNNNIWRKGDGKWWM